MRQRGVIIDVQHAPLPWHNGLRQRCYRGRGFSNTRQVDVKGCPCPGVLCTVTAPPWWVTMPWTTARPIPVPSPTPLVVKNGSKICSITPGGIPWPVSRTLSQARSQAGVPDTATWEALHLHSIKAYCQCASTLPHGMCCIGAQVQNDLVHFRDAREDCPHILLHVLLEQDSRRQVRRIKPSASWTSWCSFVGLCSTLT